MILMGLTCMNTYRMFYNLAFTSLPVIFLGILDQDVNDTISLVVPQLYRVGILRKEWNQRKFLWYMLDDYISLLSVFFPRLVLSQKYDSYEQWVRIGSSLFCRCLCDHYCCNFV
ncbi:ANM_HP_G0103780.mRNA.1.CDS.1 [Saccharomyces cerevisiae]|nr:ANM_HP_G0103780.mRNA.1.CDS.1 [Saccharomyces cerevisiae]CAI6424819.1 ANM_HP_G0103780.mRNA.1.CDS.1 [Saccharomyces cerevisiae]